MAKNHDHSLDHSIAIVGMTGRFPGARNIEQFWRNLRDGVDSVRSFSACRPPPAGWCG